MPTNDIKPFATGGGANVISQAAYEALATLLANGFTGGIAESAKLNKVWRQSSFMAAVLAQFIVDKSGQDVLDDGDVAALVTKLTAAVNALIAAGVPDASTTVKGKVELATVAEAVAGLLSNVAVTPDGLAAAIAAALSSIPPASIGKHTVSVPASFVDPTITSGCGYYSRIEVAAGQPEVAFLPFDAAVEESAEFRIPVPKSWNGGTITARAIWSHAAATAYGVVWGVKAAFLGNDDAHALAFGAEVTVTDLGGTTNDVYVSDETAAITASGTPADEGLLIVRVSRKAANAADTLNVDARLEAVKIIFTTDAATDA